MTESQQRHQREVSRTVARRRRHALLQQNEQLENLNYQEDTNHQSLLQTTRPTMTSINDTGATPQHTTSAPTAYDHSVQSNMQWVQYGENGVTHRYTLTTLPATISFQNTHRPQIGEPSNTRAPISINSFNHHTQPDFPTATTSEVHVFSPAVTTACQNAFHTLQENVLPLNPPQARDSGSESETSDDDVRLRVRRRLITYNIARIRNSNCQINQLQLEQPHFCSHCHAKLFDGETSTMCCNNDKIMIPTIPVPDGSIICTSITHLKATISEDISALTIMSLPLLLWVFN